VTEWATAVTTAIGAGGGFSVSDTTTIDLTLAVGVLSAAIVNGSITSAMLSTSLLATLNGVSANELMLMGG